MNINFEKIAPYLKDPLILIGFFLFLGFLLARGILTAGIIPQLSRTGGYRVLQRLLLYGFVIALALIGLGFGLKYREMSRGEQIGAVHLLQQELSDNTTVLGQLEANTETILRITNIVSRVLRTPDIKLLAALFPSRNLDPHAQAAASADLAQELLTSANNEGLFANELERRKFAAAAQTITGTIMRTASTVSSLADTEGKRYVLKSDVWHSQLPVLRKVHIVNVTDFQAMYTQLELVRANYNVVVARCIDYLTAVARFLDPPDHRVDRQSLAAVLGAERLYVEVSSEYAKTLVDEMQRVKELQTTMQHEKLAANY